MASAERSFFGLAKQSAVQVPNTTDGDFDYILFTQGQIGPASIVSPLDPEVGGGALLRGLTKLGVNVAGTIPRFTPRPNTLGHLFLGALGNVATVDSEPVVYEQLLDTTNPTVVTTGLNSPGSPIVLSIVSTDATDTTGQVTIDGTSDGSTVVQEILTLNGTTPVTGTQVFQTVTQITFPPDFTTPETVTVYWTSGAKKHTFTLPTDQFAAPHYTVRYAPGNLWGEQFTDVRFNGVALEFAGASFVRGSFGMLGRRPDKVASTGAWNALAQVDTGPQFLGPLGAIDLPTGTSAKVLRGTFAMGMNIPLDEQYIVGDYFPEALDIVSRSFVISMLVKVVDEDLYTKMSYDPDLGLAWLPEIFREADMKLEFASDIDAGVGDPYKFTIDGNGQSGDNANILWQVEPIELRAQSQVTMNVTGTFIADPLAGAPITVELINTKTAY